MFSFGFTRGPFHVRSSCEENVSDGIILKASNHCYNTSSVEAR